jgi:hypothetical protein
MGGEEGVSEIDPPGLFVHKVHGEFPNVFWGYLISLSLLRRRCKNTPPTKPSWSMYEDFFFIFSFYKVNFCSKFNKKIANLVEFTIGIFFCRLEISPGCRWDDGTGGNLLRKGLPQQPIFWLVKFHQEMKSKIKNLNVNWFMRISSFNLQNWNKNNINNHWLEFHFWFSISSQKYRRMNKDLYFIWFYDQIWLNLLMDDHHFCYIYYLSMDDCHFGCITKFLMYLNTRFPSWFPRSTTSLSRAHWHAYARCDITW